MQLLIRGVPDATNEAIARLAEQRGISKNDLLLTIITNYAESQSETASQTIAGFVRVDIAGDILPDDDCDWCDQPFLHNEQYLVVRRDGIPPAVVCRVCASDYNA